MRRGRSGLGTRPLRGLRSLRHRNYRLFFLGQLVSVAGSRMQVIAQCWLVLVLTGDPFLLGLVVAAQFGPTLIVGIFGGLIADALPKRGTLVVTQGLEMAIALVLFALTASRSVEVWQIIALAGALGVVTAIDTPTRHSFAIEMVGREDVANAIALNISTFNIARVIGPAIAGVIIAVADVSVVFLINGLSYLAVIAALLLMRTDALLIRTPTPRPGSVREVFRDLLEGLEYVRRAPVVRLVLLTLGVVSVFGMNLQVLGPPLARDVLHTDASGFGLLMSAFGAGALFSALGISMFGTGLTNIARGAVLLGLSLIGVAVSHFLPISAGLIAAAGIGAIGMGASGNITLQLTVPDHLRGRVMSMYLVVFDGAAPIGGLIMGAIASNAGVSMALLIGGAVSVLMGVLAAILLGRVHLHEVPQ